MGKPMRGSSLDAEASPGTLLLPEGGNTRAAPPCSGRLVLNFALVLLPTLAFGYNNANMLNQADLMKISFGISGDSASSDLLWGLAVSIFCAGAVPGCWVAAAMADSCGRRATLLCTSGLFLVSGVVQTLSRAPHSPTQRLVVFLVGRTLVGAASGATTVVCPLYNSELAPRHIRGVVGVCFQVVCGVGMFAGQLIGLPEWLGTEDDWCYIFALTLLPATVSLLTAPMLVESPLWLHAQGRPAHAFEANVILGLPEEVTLSPRVSLPEMNPRTPGGSEARQYGVRDLLSDKSRAVRRGLALALTLSAAQQLSGINNFFNYSSTVLKKQNASQDTIKLVTVVQNVANMGAALVSAALVDRSGRRTLLLGSLLGVIVFATLATAGFLSHSTPVTVISIPSFVFAFCLGLGPIGWMMPPELFDVTTRGPALSLTASLNWFSNFAVALTFPAINSALESLSFAPNAGLMFVVLVYFYFSLPETNGKTVEEIQDELDNE